MKKIYLSKTGTKYKGMIALVDDEDYEKLNQFNWGINKSMRRNIFYAFRETHLNDGKRVGLLMHRVIMCVNDTGIDIDHIDQDGLNNQKHNLRLCNRSQNIANSRSRKDSSSKYLGVCYDKSKNKWKAQIMKNYKQVQLGRFKDETDAARAYNEAAKKLHGEFAHLNEIS